MTATATETTETKPEPKPEDAVLGGAGQTFLIGETLYLRARELADAKRASAWRPSPFPIPADYAEELLKKEVPDEGKERTWRLVACRRGDDFQVGAVTIYSWDGFANAFVEVRVDPAFGAARGPMEAELLGLVVPWLQTERERFAVQVGFDDGQAELVRAAEALGMRPAARLRGAVWRDAARRDLLFYEALHPAWLGRFGDPGPGIAHAVAPEDPGRRREQIRSATVEPEGDPPRNAVMVGQRIFLRPVEAEDAAQEAHWSRRERETFFDDGRRARSSIGIAQWHRKLAEDDPPGWVRFAVCLRETGEYIGSNGIADIDYVHRTAETESFFHRPDYRGGGYGTEAKHLLLAYAFERLGLHQVRSFVWGPNGRSAAALRKQGYRDAGRFNWTGTKDGQITHDFIFDLLADEWREMQGR